MISSQKKPELITFGCRLNAYESEVIRKHAEAQGLENAVIINTCAVTNEAERQARQAIRRARRDHPDAFLLVTGCSAQIRPHVYQAMPEVDRVLGNLEKMKVESYAPDLPQKSLVSDIMAVKETAHHLIQGFEGQVRAFIEIQNGCDHRCTFCTIPFGRGNNRSVPMPEIFSQIKTLVMSGTQEIVLTGVDITGYGADLPGTPPLGQMIRRLFKHIPDLKRLRLSSLDPVEIDEDLLNLIGSEPRLMPHIHLSLQAGDNMILKRMKRRHLREDVIVVCEHIKALRSDVVFGADIIAGFPTETDEMFQNSLKIVEECDLTYLHVFPYSPREGTPASRMPQVKRSVIKERAAALRELGERRLQAFLESQKGKVVSILVERNRSAHTEHYAPVRIEGGKGNLGQILLGRVIDIREEKLVVEPL